MKAFLYIVTAVLAAFIFGTAYVMYAKDSVTSDYATAHKTLAEIRNEITISHLWFEETISGHEHATFDSFWDIMDKLDGKIELLQTLHTQNGVGSQRIPEIAGDLKQRLKSFRSIAYEREMNLDKDISARLPDLKLDAEFDAAFNAILDTCHDLDNVLTLSRAQDLAPFRTISITLIVVGVLAVSGVLLFIWRSWEKRVHEE